MKYLIVGLGNLGEKYENTRHNIGFKVIDAFAEERKVSFESVKLGELAEAKWKGRSIVLLKPSTFMNLSGKAVNYYLQKEKIDIENLLVIVDDLALPFGKLRMRGKGSDGGHNGLKDIQEKIQTSNFARLRFGIGSDFYKGQQVDFVLSEWSNEESGKMNERMNITIEFIKNFTTIGLEHTMSNWNNK